MPIDIRSSGYKAEKEKSSVVLGSVIVAATLTTLKLVAGLATHSLGILAEAAHSGLALVAALVTFIAVRTSRTPADPEHPYGHGRVETFSALVETLLLLATCVWIVYESIQRLFVRNVAVNASSGAFLVMGLSLIVDVFRSGALHRAAQKRRSRTLKADARHFSAGIWGSLVVILGLVGVRLAAADSSLRFLEKADAVAALVVAAVVGYVGGMLSIRTMRGLRDQAPKSIAAQVEQAVAAIPGILECHQVYARPAGPAFFVEVYIRVSSHQTLTEAQTLTRQVADVVCRLVSRADVTVHAEPVFTMPPSKRVAVADQEKGCASSGCGKGRERVEGQKA